VGKTLHRIVVGVWFLAVVSFLYFTYVGIDTYIESGRSLMGDSRTAIRYEWKPASCSSLFNGLFPSSLPAEADELCTTARAHGIPPLAVKPFIDDEITMSGLTGKPLEAVAANASLTRMRTVFLGKLPALEKHYSQHYRDIRGMWFFFPLVMGSVGLYYYARSFTPILFGRAKDRFERVMFGKNKYFSNWDKFLKQNRSED
jgi:hypothetical protein